MNPNRRSTSNNLRDTFNKTEILFIDADSILYCLDRNA